MFHFGEFLKTWSLRSNSVTRQVSFNRSKIGGKCQNWKIQMRDFWVIFKHCGPRAFLTRIAFPMKSWLPTMTDPTGVPSPLLKHTLTEAQSLTNSLAGTFNAAAVLNNLAPSQCKGKLRSLQALPTLWSQDIGTARPPHLLCEFSMQTSIVIGEWGSLGPMISTSNQKVLIN